MSSDDRDPWIPVRAGVPFGFALRWGLFLRGLGLPLWSCRLWFLRWGQLFSFPVPFTGPCLRPIGKSIPSVLLRVFLLRRYTLRGIGYAPFLSLVAHCMAMDTISLAVHTHHSWYGDTWYLIPATRSVYYTPKKLVRARTAHCKEH